MNGEEQNINESWENESSQILLKPELTKKLQVSRVVSECEIKESNNKKNEYKVQGLQLMVIALIKWISEVVEPSKREIFKELLWKYAENHNLLPVDLDKNTLGVFAEKLHKNILRFFEEKLGDVRRFNLSIDNNISIQFSQNLLNMGQNKYESDFQECECIGKGGFGSVHKVKNYIDGRFYAVKKVIFKNDDNESITEALKEVQHLSMLEHGGIVRYYHSWIDTVRIKRRKRSSTGRSLSECKIEEISSDDESDVEFVSFSDNKKNGGSIKSNDDIDIVFHKENTSLSSTSSGGKGLFVKPETTTLDSVEFSSSSDESNGSDSTIITNRTKEIVLHKNNGCYITRSALFIQMELLTTNLEELLLNKEFKNSVIRKSFNRKAIYTLISALSYIHEMGIIHRDIKSVNIFVKKAKDDWIIKLGDFGLSCQSFLQDNSGEMINEKERKDKITSISNISVYHTKGLGSVNYAPEEQMKTSVYGTEVDVFALGMVFYEMLSDFDTRSECYIAFQELRRTETLPHDFIKKYPKKSKLIESMICKNPQERVTAKELLTKLNRTVNPEAFHFILSENDNLKRHLQNMNAELDMAKNKNVELQKKVEELEERLKEYKK
uniref:Protein kinase domain-containing protein n=1 Tax=Parastrongyloides trichosuri TaxID=131310 RepID=A0A0N4ZLU5_PARTI